VLCLRTRYVAPRSRAQQTDPVLTAPCLVAQDQDGVRYKAYNPKTKQTFQVVRTQAQVKALAAGADEAAESCTRA
jgi:hypothetical protein